MKGCNKCGKELGFFERSVSVDSPRVNIHYDQLCSDCYKTIKESIDQIEQMYQRVLESLKLFGQQRNQAKIDIDRLIYLSVEALMVVEPNYHSEETSLHQTIINRKERLVNKHSDMSRVVYKVMSYGFKDALERAGLEVASDFTEYFMKTTLYVEQMIVNCSDTVPMMYANVFFSRKGLVIERIEPSSFVYVHLAEGQSYDFHVEDQGAQSSINFTNLYYQSNGEKAVICAHQDPETIALIVRTLKDFNDKTVAQITKIENEIIESVYLNIEKDREELEDEKAKGQLDALLLFTVKNIHKDEEIEDKFFDDAEGLAVKILFSRYGDILEEADIQSEKDLVAYVKENCASTPELDFRIGAKKPYKGYGFFTPKGYFVGLSKKNAGVFQYTTQHPNDVYYGSEDLVIKSKQYVYLPLNSNSEEPGFREPDGLLIHSDNINEVLQLSDYFKKESGFFKVDQFLIEQEAIVQDSEKMMELKRIADQLFKDFGYLPFCLYDEWYFIETSLREGSPILQELITSKEKLRPHFGSGEIIYGKRIVDAYIEGAKDLMRFCDIRDLDVAKGVLWTYFRKVLVRDLAEEWARLGGDIVTPEDDINSAFQKYSGLTEIEPDRTYYIGLFIYYLMQKGVLANTDFIEHYESCVRIYLDSRRNVEKIDRNVVAEEQALFQREEQVVKERKASVNVATVPEELEKTKVFNTEEILAALDSENEGE